MNTSKAVLFFKKEKLKICPNWQNGQFKNLQFDLTDKTLNNKISEGFQESQGRDIFLCRKIFPQRCWRKKEVLLPKFCQGGKVSKSFLPHPLWVLSHLLSVLSLSVEARDVLGFSSYAPVRQDSQPAWPCFQATQTRIQSSAAPMLPRQALGLYAAMRAIWRVSFWHG